MRKIFNSKVPPKGRACADSRRRFLDNQLENPCTEDCRLLGTKIATKTAHAQNFNSKFPPNFAHAPISSRFLCQATCNPLYCGFTKSCKKNRQPSDDMREISHSFSTLTYLHATNTCNFTGHLQQGGCSKVWRQCQIGIAAQLWEVHYLPPGGQQDMASPLLLRPQSWGQLFPVLADPGSESTTALQWGVTHFALSRLWQNLSCVHGTAVETCSFV